MAIAGIIGILVLLFVGAPIFAVLLGAGAFGAAFGRGMVDFSGQLTDVLKLGTGEPAQVLSTIPLFILAGYFMSESRTADRLVKVSQAGLGWLPGSLAVVTIFACAIFTTFTGASGVTIVALGTLLMPALVKQKYPERFSLGLIGGTGSVGLLFPPALPLFVYGTVYGLAAQAMQTGGEGEMKLIDFSTDRFIFAGIVPGMVLIGIIAVYSMIQAKRAGVVSDWSAKKDLKDFAPALARALPEILIPFLVIAAIVMGVTIAEAAALTVVYVFVLEVLVFKDLDVRKLPGIIRESMALVGAIFIIILAASAFTNWLTTARIPQELLAWITATFESKWTFLLALNIVLLFVGMTMDIFSAIVVVVPLITPAAIAFGIDPYHLGVVFLLNLEIGYLTPPVGLNLFITSYTFDRPIDRVVKATFPFLLCMVVALVLVTYIPALTVVPAAERRARVAQLGERVQQAAKRATSVQAVTLPDGTEVKLAACEQKSGLDQQECVGVFLAVTKCRRAEGKASACEEKVLADYARSLSLAEGGGSEDDWDSWDEDADGGVETDTDADAGVEEELPEE